MADTRLTGCISMSLRGREPPCRYLAISAPYLGVQRVPTDLAARVTPDSPAVGLPAATTAAALLASTRGMTMKKRALRAATP